MGGHQWLAKQSSAGGVEAGARSSVRGASVFEAMPSLLARKHRPYGRYSAVGSDFRAPHDQSLNWAHAGRAPAHVDRGEACLLNLIVKRRCRVGFAKKRDRDVPSAGAARLRAAAAVVG